MMAFANVEDEVACYGTLLIKIDELEPFDMWITLVCAYFALVILWKGLNGGRKGKSPHTWCRHSRLFRCHKRKMRGKKEGKESCIGISWECPLTKLRRMPPPLPFRRRRERCKQAESETTAEMIVQESSVRVFELSAATQLIEQIPTLHESSRVSETQLQTKAKYIPSKPPALQTTLIDLARMQQWSRLIDRVTFNKREARYTDSDGLMPLHWACSGGPPLEVIHALLQAYPRASRRVDSDGSTALHFACHYGGSVSVVYTLLEAYPEAVRIKDKYGRTPLFHAVNKASNVDVIRALINSEPLMVIEPCFPVSSDRPFDTHDRWHLHHRTPLFMAWSAVTASQSRRRHRTERALDKAHLLLESAYIQLTSRRTYRVLHAAIMLDSYLPPHVIRLAIDHYPEQLRELDERVGRLPLALAADLRSQRAPEVIQLLCKAFPQAARAFDAQGQTALMIALASGKHWNEGVKAIFDAAPGVLKMRDRQSRIYPALVAASVTNAQHDEETRKIIEHKMTRGYSPNITSRHLRTQVQSIVAVDGEKAPHALEWNEFDAEARRLSTIYEIIQADPSIVKW
jgi:ankyrin repeat protein